MEVCKVSGLVAEVDCTARERKRNSKYSAVTLEIHAMRCCGVKYIFRLELMLPV